MRLLLLLLSVVRLSVGRGVKAIPPRLGMVALQNRRSSSNRWTRYSWTLPPWRTISRR